jgi:hypothetical protein
MRKLRFMQCRVHALNYENPQSYKISDILGMVNEDYLEFICRRTEQAIGQKTLTGGSVSRDQGMIRNILADEDQFHHRFNSLSEEAKGFYYALYYNGRVWDSGKEPHNTSRSKLKAEVRECMDKLIVFGLPSHENPEIFIIPVDYAVIDNFRPDSKKMLPLIDLLKSYPVALINRIAREYDLKTASSKLSVTIETGSTILKNLERTLENLSPTENRIMDYLMENEGISNFSLLIDHFKMRNKNVYYRSVDFTNLFSSTSYSGGEQFISLMQKGLIYCSKRMYYSSIDIVYVPDEVLFALRQIRHKKMKPHEGGKKEAEKIYSNLKNYAVDYAAEMKALFITVYYLESRSKKRTAESIGKFVSMPEEDLDLVLNQSKIELWLKGGVSSLSITPEGYDFIGDSNFPKKLKQHIYEDHIFSAWRRSEATDRLFLNELRSLFLDAVYNMQYPEKVDHMLAEIKTSDKYFKLSRSLRIALMQESASSSNSESMGFMKQTMENEMSLWLLELINFLRIYGLIRTSSPVTTPDVYIFPEQEFMDIYGKKGELMYGEDKKADTKPIKVLPNNDILIGVEADFTDLKKVADFSELISADLICTFRITKASISSYLNRSGKLHEVISFLKEKSSVPVPNTVLRLINDMEKKEDEVTITKCQAILQVGDRTVIDGIMRIPGIAHMIEKRISPEILSIKEGVSLYKFVTELRKKGYIVPIKVEREKKEKSRRPSWYSW